METGNLFADALQSELTLGKKEGKKNAASRRDDSLEFVLFRSGFSFLFSFANFNFIFLHIHFVGKESV